MRTVLQGRSCVQCCQHTHTHTHSSEQCFYAFAICLIFLFQWLISYSYQILKQLCIFIHPLLIHTHCFTLHIWRLDVLHIYCLIGVYCLNHPFCIAYSCVLNTVSLRVWIYSRISDSFIVRSNASGIS